MISKKCRRGDQETLDGVFSSKTGDLRLEEDSHFSVGDLIEDELSTSLIILVRTNDVEYFT